MSGDVVPAGTLTAQQSVTMLNKGVLIYFFVLRRVQTLTLGPLVNAGVVFNIFPSLFSRLTTLKQAAFTLSQQYLQR